MWYLLAWTCSSNIRQGDKVVGTSDLNWLYCLLDVCSITPGPHLFHLAENSELVGSSNRIERDLSTNETTQT